MVNQFHPYWDVLLVLSKWIKSPLSRLDTITSMDTLVRVKRTSMVTLMFVLIGAHC